jgi:hypothetical protein
MMVLLSQIVYLVYLFLGHGPDRKPVSVPYQFQRKPMEKGLTNFGQPVKLLGFSAARYFPVLFVSQRVYCGEHFDPARRRARPATGCTRSPHHGRGIPADRPA